MIDTRFPIFANDDYLIHNFRSSYLGSNSYIVEIQDLLYVVDTGYNNEKLIEFLQENDKPLDAVFLTHAHFDHAGTAKEISERFHAPIFVIRDDRGTLRQNNFLLKALGQLPDFKTPDCDFVDGGFQYEEFQIHSCPGHTPGSALITFRDLIFTGDSVYSDCISLVSLPGENETTLRNSLHSHSELLKDSAGIFPGHGSFTNGERLFRENTQLNNFLSETN